MTADDRGQVTPLVALLAALAAGAALILAHLGARAGEHARAEAAAEATALALVVDGHEIANDVAIANGAVIVAADPGPPAVVTVRLGDVEATAAADLLTDPVAR